MRRVFTIIFYLLISNTSFCQEHENTFTAVEQQAETMAEKEGVEMEDDSFLMQLENFRKHPLNLNEASSADLKELVLLNDLQIENFLNYRRLLGKLLDVYELQAVPSWNIDIIKKLQPYIIVGQDINFTDNIKERWSKGGHELIFRTSQVLEKAAGYLKQADSGSHFLGNENRFMFRYTYNYRNLLQWGLLGDKDAGEQFFKGKQKAGFDFYSFHFFLSRLGIIKSLAIGDFTVNMGQGLIQWQSFAFTKSAEISFIKRQSPVLHPYTAAGEYNFHRGAGITLQKGKWETTIFLSIRKLSGNLVKDSVKEEGHISSVSTSGYNRTPGELEDRNNLKQFTAGASLRYGADKWHIAANTVLYRFSLPLKKEDKPYNIFAASGKKFSNESFDYSYTYKNCHLFGELAVDKNANKAFVNGVLASLSPAIDLSLIYRSISRRYQSFYANAFTENSAPVNEKGLYAGLSIRPSEYIQINTYADTYRFPWLKYRVDAPSCGREYFIQITYKPNKQVELYSYLKNEVKQQNISGDTLTMSALENITRQNWRINSSITLNRAFTIRNRLETIIYNKKQVDQEEGFIMFTDVLFKPAQKHWSGNMRFLYFETAGYNSRLYAFENDALYNFSIPAIFDRGYRYYININFEISKWMKYLISQKATAECWLRAAQTIYTLKNEIGSGPDTIIGNKKTELKFQMVLNF